VVDTNILFSAVLYPDGKPRRLFTIAGEKGVTINVLDYSLEELMGVFRRKGLAFGPVRSFIDNCQTVIYQKIGDISNEEARAARECVSDEKDRPIFAYVYRRIMSGIDCFLVTGDKGLLTAAVKASLMGRAYSAGDFIQMWDDFRFIAR
jgi:predicted nucleic acid-binding protein